MGVKLFSNRSRGPDWLVVFLGNPGSQYERTRHNMGFLAGDSFACAHDVKINRINFRAAYGLMSLGQTKICLLKPHTFMNLSGESVRAAADFYKIAPERIIVVLDDINLPAGRLRVRPGGSSGGHRGLQNIIDHLHTDSIARVRIGVGHPENPSYDVIDWVISRMTQDELRAMLPAIERAGRAVEEIILNGVYSAMEKYNRTQ